MKKKLFSILAALFIFCFTTVNCYLQPVYASMPGIVEASVLWEGWETLALILGITLDFDNNLTISKNNDIQYEYYYNAIMNDNSLSSAEKSQLVTELDNTRNGFIDNIVDVSSNLWSWLTNLIYKDFIQTQVNLVPYLSGPVLEQFNAYEGPVGLYRQVGSLNGNGSGGVVIVYGSSAYETPIFIEQRTYQGSIQSQWYIASEGSKTIVYSNWSSPFTYNYAFPVWFNGSAPTVQYFTNKAIDEVVSDDANENSLVGSPSWQDYIDGITGNFSIVDGSLVDVNTGESPIVLDGESLDDVISGIQDGTLTYDQAIDQAFENTDTGEITDYPSPISKKALDELIAGLNLSRLENKFPFCIPHDIQLIYNGATVVSGNAPVLTIPIHLEVRDTVYYDDEDFLIIDFSMFDDIIPIFREGFFLLFLVGLLWVSIEILQAFFVVTE